MAAVVTLWLPMVAAPAVAAPSSPPVTPAAGPGRPVRTLSTVEAAAKAKAAQTGQPVTVDAQTTPTEQVQANPDGTFTMQVSALPVRVRQRAGWVGLDANLHPNPDGTYSPNAVSAGLVLSGGDRTDPSGSGGTAAPKPKPLATMANGTARLSLYWPTPLPTPTVSGASLTYSNVLQDVDLVVTADQDGGFSHVLVIHNAVAAQKPDLATLRLRTETSGIDLSETAGGVEGVDRFGRTVFNAQAPLMWDSSITSAASTNKTQGMAAATDDPAASTPAGPGSGAKVSTVGVDVSQNAVTLTPDPVLLKGTGVTYPVYVDPSWNSNSTSLSQNGWTYVDSYRPGQSYFNSKYNDGIARVGYQTFDPPAFTARSFFQFAIPTSIWGAHVNQAQLQIRVVWSPDNTTHSVSVYNTGAIGASTTWNNQPAKGDKLTHEQVAANYDKAPGIWQEFTITSRIQKDLDPKTHVARETLGLYNDDENHAAAWRKFDHNPTIAIDYDFPPDTPSNAVTSPAVPCAGGAIGNTDITFSAKLTDMDGGQGQLAAYYDITNTATKTKQTATISVSNNNNAVITVPASAFADKTTYSWHVYASDGHALSQTTNDCTFTIDHTQPGQPTINSATYPETSTGAPARTPGDFVITPTGTESPVRYVYSLNTPPPTPLPHGPELYPDATAIDAQPNSAATTITITPRRVDANTLYVYAVDAAGNPSALAAYPFRTGALTTPDVPGDLTGDGLADALTVGDTGDPGLWLHPGADTSGHVGPAIQVGGDGTGGNQATGHTTDWTGTTADIADLTGDQVNDVIIRLPAAANTGDSNVEVIPGTGDGNTLDPDHGFILQLPPVDAGDGGQTVAQVAAVPSSDPTTGVTTVDLYATVGDNLYRYTASNPPGTFNLPDPVSAGWAHRSITGLPIAANAALFSRDQAGELDLWTGNTATGVLAGADGTNTVYATTGFASPAVTAVTGADIDHDGRPDLWATTNTGHLDAYRNNTASGFLGAVTNALTASTAFRSGLFNKCLTASGTVAQINDCASTPVPPWTMPGDGTLHTGNNCLDTTGGGTANNTAVMVTACTAAATQIWHRTAAGGLRQTASGRCLDIPSSNPLNGTALQIHDCNGTNAQTWATDNSGPLVGTPDNKCVDDPQGTTADGTQVQLYACNNTSAQRWTSPGDGTLRVNGKCLDSAGGGTAKSTAVVIGACSIDPTTSASQHWQAGSTSGFVNAKSGLCLDDPQGNTANGTHLQITTCNNTTGQMWDLRPPATGSVDIALLVNCLTATGAPAYITTCDTTASQTWSVPGDGTIRITNKCLEIVADATVKGSKVQTNTCNAHAGQQWTSSDHGALLNPATGLCLDDPQSNVTTKLQLQIYTCNDTNAQNWNLPL